MPNQILRILFCALAILLVGNSFPASASSDEENLEDCGPALTPAISLVPNIEFKLTGEVPSMGAQALLWEADYNGGPSWINAIQVESGTINGYQTWISAAPGRVRIMPVGKTPPIVNGNDPQVTRDRAGRILLLAPRSSGIGSDIFTVADGKLSALAIIHSDNARLFTGLGDHPWVAWSETDENLRVTVKAALFEGLTPAFAYLLNEGESAIDFAYDRDSESRGKLAILTNRRLLIFTNSSR